MIKNIKNIFLLFTTLFIICVSIKNNNVYAKKLNDSNLSKDIIIDNIESTYNKKELEKTYINKVRDNLKGEAKDSEYYFIQGYIDYSIKDYKGAIKNFELAKKDIKNSKYIFVKVYNYILLNNCLLEEGKSENLIENAKNAITYIKKDKSYKNNSNVVWEVIFPLSYNTKTKYESIKLLESYIEETRNLDIETKMALRGDLAIIYTIDRKYGKAIYNYSDVIYLAKKNPNINKASMYEAKAYTFIGNIVYELGMHKEAITWYDRAVDVKIPNKINNAEAKVNTYINQMHAYLSINDYDKCSDVVNKTKKYIKYLDKNKQDDVEILLNYNIANINIHKGNYEEAKKYIKKGTELLKEDKVEYFIHKDIFLGLSYASILKEEGNYEEALEIYNQMLELPNEDARYIEIDIYSDMAEIYSKIGDLESYRKYNEILKEKKKYLDGIIKNDYIKYSIKAYENEVLKDKEKNEQIKVLIMTCIVVILIIILVARIVRVKALKKLHYQDSMTGLNNRRYLDDYEQKNVKKLEEKEISIVLIDIDYFKKYNDNYGHIKGDKVIKEVSNSVLMNIRKDGIAIRFGGEEIVIILEDTSGNEAIEIVEKIQNDIKNKAIEHKYSLVNDIVTISIGIYTKQKNMKEDIYLAIDKADKALYESKNNGRDRYSIYN